MGERLVMPSVTFETKCWENDWEFLLKTNRLSLMAQRNNFEFANKTLFINNVNDYKKVAGYAQKLKDKGILTDFHMVRDYEDEALKFFQLSKEILGKGYVYSIAELVSLYLCQTDFLLHFSGDAMPAQSTNWIEKVFEKFDKNPQFKVANLTWDHKYEEARSESLSEDDDFFSGYGFSDQMYLVRTSDFKAPIYNEAHPDSERYPQYGGELFEKRVDSWMRNHEYQRLTYKHGSYLHKNFPHHPLKRKARLFLDKYAK